MGGRHRENDQQGAPLVVGNQIITGVSGDDLDRPGYIESPDPETGDLQWRTYTVPIKPGDPGLDTWPSLEAAQHGGGMTWITPTYDPELNLIYFGTGNPQPVMAGKGRKGDNKFTESILALNPDTGKMAWGFQVSPHDTHDWDGVETPVLIDGEINGPKHKLVSARVQSGHRTFLCQRPKPIAFTYIFDDSEKPEGWGGNDRGGWQKALFEGGGSRRRIDNGSQTCLRRGSGGEFHRIRGRYRPAAMASQSGQFRIQRAITYELDGSQYVVVAAVDTLFGFIMNAR
jgi:hypothetical protein